MRRGLLAALTLACLAPPLGASAHLGHTLVRAERYLKIDLREGEVRLVVTLTLGEEQGGALMRAADDDGDRKVDEAEAERHLATWAAALREELVLTANGAPVELEFGDGFFDPRGPVRRVVATLEMVGRGTLRAGEVELALHDRMANREVFERTDVSLVAAPPVVIVAAGLESAEVPPRPAYAFGPKNAPERIVLSVESPPEPAGGGAGLALLLGALGLAGVLFSVWRRRARADRARL